MCSSLADGSTGGFPGVLKAVGAGLVATVIAVLVLGAPVAVGYWLIDPQTRSEAGKLVTSTADVALVLAFAVGGWVASRVGPGFGPIRIGALTAIVVLVITIAVAIPLLEDRTALRDVGIALGMIEAPNVAVQTSVALDKLIGSKTLSQIDSAQTEARITAAVAGAHFVLSLAALLTGAILGSLLARTSTGERRRSLAGSGLIVAVLAVVIATWAMWPSIWSACHAVFDTDQSGGPELGINLSEVAQHPEVMWGATVTVSAAIDQVLSPNAIVIGNHKPMIGNVVLVVARQPLSSKVLVIQAGDAEFAPGRVVQVRGRVQPFDPATLEQQLAIDLSEARSAYSGKSVLIADAIDLDVPIFGQTGDKEFLAATGGYDLGVTLDDIGRAPEKYVGERVTVSGEVEEHLLTNHAFLLDDVGVLAVSAAPHPELYVEATAYVEGEVRLFDLKQIEAELGIDLDDELLAPHEGKPVIIVDKVVLIK